MFEGRNAKLVYTAIAIIWVVIVVRAAFNVKGPEDFVVTVAQSEVQADGRVIEWQADRDGYRFVRAGKVLEDDALLRPRPWQASAVAVRRTPDRPVRLDPEWIGEALTLRLVSGQQQIEVHRAAGGRVEVRQP